MEDPINMSETSSTYSDIQAKRLIQFFWAIQVTLLLAFFQRLYFEQYLDGTVVFIAIIAYFPVLTLLKKNKVLPAAILLLTITTLFCSYFMWTHEGIYDELVLAYPGIFIVASIIGNKKLFNVLLLFVSLSIAINGIGNELGWYNNDFTITYLDSTIIYLLTLWLLSYAIWALSSDVRLLLKKQTEEHQQVLQSKKDIENLLNHDLLTGLPNRVMAQTLFTKALETAQKDKLKVCLMFIDIDNFKQINDGLGHKAGDELLKEIAIRLKKEIRGADFACRFAGDEFIIIMQSIKNEDIINRIAYGILNTLTTPFNYQDHELICSCSIGISIAPDDGTDFSDIIQKADTAMYRSKGMGGNVLHFYNYDMDRQGNDYLNQVIDLRKALREEQFVLHYQPKLDLLNQKVIGAEALIRWQHPEKGLIFPDAFIAQAEKSGLINEMGDWVLRTACIACKSWMNNGLGELSIAVNVSSEQFKRNHFSQTVEAALAKSDLPAEYLELEMTESLFIDNSSDLKRTIKYLRALGIIFSIDDFGTGYSNLSYLKEFDIELLKIDRSFVKDIDQNPKNKALVTAIIQMAKALSLKTVGEGIENQEVTTILQDLECDYGQGYHWSKPLPEQEFVAFVKAFENN